MSEPTRAGGLANHVAVLACYAVVAIVFWWPLPLHLADALPGRPSGDAGVYVWNLWLFRHEILTHQTSPFTTFEILNAGSQAVPLALHNYTPFAGALALPLIGWIGLVPTFNLLVMANSVGSAYAMFLFAWRRTGDAGAGFVGGLLFGFSPYMMARGSEHFSLAQAAPLPIFGLLMLQIFQNPRPGLAVLAGLTVAWAYLSDPYYGVYCLMIAAFTMAYSIVSVEPRPARVRRAWWPAALTLTLLCTAGLIAGVVLSGGGKFSILGLSVSVRHVYTPVLILTIAAAVRLWIAFGGRLTWAMPFGSRHLRAAAITAGICLLALTPVLVAMASPSTGRIWAGPPVWWRSSAPGIDAIAWFLPNPLHPWFGGHASGWLASLPNGYVENVASIPWTALGIIAAAWLVTGLRGTRGWWSFLALFGLMSLGPFIRVAGVDTYVPTPWAILRYLPVMGAARMPTRLTVLVMMALAMLVALAVASLRAGAGRRRHWMVIVPGLLLVFELLPAPPLFSAAVPEVYRTVGADPRVIRVLQLPFGFKDGLESYGRFSTSYQYYQTVHEKPLFGGYLSRLPVGSLERSRDNPILGVLLRLSDGEPVTTEMLQAAVDAGPAFVAGQRLGYVLVDRTRASAAAVAFAERALSLTLVREDDGFALYQTPLAD